MIKNKKQLVGGLLLIGLFFIVFSIHPFEKTVDFNTEVRPILNEHCLRCHGGVKQMGGLSFLFEEEAFGAMQSGKKAIVRGNARKSEMIKRLKHSNPAQRMPYDSEPLSKSEISILTKWVNQGAKWSKHWAYIPPKAAELPNVKPTQDFTPNNEIDQFILSKIQEKNLKPSPKADKATLFRRVSLDLIGLPPALEEVEKFEKNKDANAFEKVVDSLLASPHFGERWAIMWMDLARYGDSKGYQKDNYRSIWRYRDWLIDAFNNDMPYDQFTIEQLAGDLLPQPSESQLLATAFHRNTMNNDEGGTDDEEFRVAAVLDRVNTTMEVWQGTTISCVQCHSHPYDPFKHEEYYKLYAFFNNTQDRDTHNEFPTLPTFSKTDFSIIKKLCQTALEKEITPKSSQELDAIRSIIIEIGETNSLKDSLSKFELVKTPILREQSDSVKRKTHLFERGNWLVHGKQVYPDVPKSIYSLPKDTNYTRLDLANWLVSDKNPLTARVMVNRIWAELFGQGIVTTIEDFGTQSVTPSHVELLDWLAVDFQKHQSLKTLLKKMVLSATYQQSSVATKAHLENDPQNIWLARMSRIRLSAEQLRDQALAVSGLLSSKMYGRSVMPPQPDGVWQVIRHVMRWEESEKEDRYRRALYTFWRKSSPYPAFLTFDSPSKELCVSRRIRTNTPLQALNTLNDTVYVEAARVLAQQMLAKENLEAQLIFGYQKVLFKTPNPQVVSVLKSTFSQNLVIYQEHLTEAQQIALTDDEGTPTLAALTTVANVLLNLDEVIVRE